MKCHYEVLGVPRDVTSDDLKKAYRVLALRWHPDKNLDKVKEAQEQFLLVQQAYEVLSDPHERAFYDKYRESIIRGSHGVGYEDDSLDIFPYFSSSCFKGYGDDDKGFYSVYREVFNKIAAEDSEFMYDDSDFEVPSFGDSQSSYEDVVHPFYAYWLSYSTKKSFAWLDPHDIRNAPNRRVLRFIEKENKKVRDKAKKERNEEIRNLVSFVRKRDKRVQIYKKILEERASANAKKSEEKRKQLLKEKQAALQDYKESEWSKFSNLERELREIEARMVAEYGESEESSADEIDSDIVMNESVPQNMYCVACDKMFKTDKAFANHENSKKHKENLDMLKAEVTENEMKLGGNRVENGAGSTLESGREEEEDDLDSDVEEEVEIAESKAKKKKKRKSKIVNTMVNSEDSDSNVDLTFAQSKKQRKKQQIKQTKSQQHTNGLDSEEVVEDSGTQSGEGEMSDIEDADDESTSLSIKKGKKSRESKRIPESGAKAKIENDESRDGSKTRKKRPKENKKTISEMLKKTENGEGEGSALETKGKTTKEPRRKAKKDVSSPITDVKDLNLCCVTCNSEFPSKNKLFDHLKKSGHSVYLPKSNEDKTEGKRTRKKKGEI